MNLKNLTVGERFIIDWQYRMAGSFKETLAHAFGIADGQNFNKLKKGFPDEAQAFYDYQNTKGWWDAVKAKAEI